MDIMDLANKIKEIELELSKTNEYDNIHKDFSKFLNHCLKTQYYLNNINRFGFNFKVSVS